MHLKVKPTTTIKSIKEQILEKISSSENLILFFNNKKLRDDEKTLSDYNIKNDSVIQFHYYSPMMKDLILALYKWILKFDKIISKMIEQNVKQDVEQDAEQDDEQSDHNPISDSEEGDNVI